MLQLERFLALLNKYTSGNISPEEYDELFSLIASGDYDVAIEEHVRANYQREDLPGADLHPYRAQQLMHQILTAEKQTSRILPRIFRKKKWIRWSAAACISGVIIVAAYLIFNIPGSNTVHALSVRQDEKMINKVNGSNHAIKLSMEDGSLVTLQPGSTLQYPSPFRADKREVYLEGEGFFHITGNAGRPFLVYHSHLITQVLGTSFIVKSDKQKKVTEVSVVTGKVQVYENNKISESNRPRNTGVILLPNQKVLYKEVERQFLTTLVNDPVPVVGNSVNAAKVESVFLFEETPLQEVLQILEKYYGIEIVVENDRIYKRLFTGDITKHGLYTQLDIICQSIQATYEIVGTRILIRENRF